MRFKQRGKQLIWPNLRRLCIISMANGSGEMHPIRFNSNTTLLNLPPIDAATFKLSNCVSLTFRWQSQSPIHHSNERFRKDSLALISTLVLSIYTLRLFSCLVLITHLIFNHTIKTKCQRFFFVNFLYVCLFEFFFCLASYFSYLFIFLKNKIDLFFD